MSTLNRPQRKAWKQAATRVTSLFDRALTTRRAQQLMEWKKADPRQAEELDHAIDLWTGMESLAEDPEIQDWQKTALASQAKRPAFYRIGYPIAAAILLGMIVSLWQLQPDNNVQEPSDIARYSTALGEQKTVQLPDGSTVILNTGSSLLVDFSADRRRAVLDYGEVWFDVAQDANRPFVVELDSHALTVLGTQFNVRKVHSQLSVALVEGVVACHPKAEIASTAAINTSNPDLSRGTQYRLVAGDLLTIENTAKPQVEISATENIAHYASWRLGKVYFENQYLYQVVQEINRYTNRKVFIDDATVMNLSVTAVLHLSELDDVLTGLEQSLPITVKRYPDSIVITGKN
ncbi:FecR domain-containing protein [Porticoccaceae bacterium LTM1]|nr:FecR domain-containing protein [Porticoccaceae bacterium LTM1]